LIEFRDVSYSYGDFTALNSLSFEIKRKEKVVLLGNNGCGKSTMLKILAGLIYPKSGAYLYNEKEVTKRYLKNETKSFRKEVAILFQNPDTMLFNPTVRDEIAFGINELNLNIDIEEVAKRFEISHLLERSPLKLSGGEKQKVALAAIFAIEPKLLLLDEPTANMDPKSTGWLVDFLQEIDITTIISTHNLSLAIELGDRAIVMDKTHTIIYDDKIDELFENKELLLKANLVHKHKKLKHSHFHIHNWG